MWRLLKFVCVVATASLLQGCTAMLWQREFCGPAPEPGLKLFRVGDDVLVSYEEVKEEKGSVWRRSFLLNASTNALAEHRKPFFFDPRKEDYAEPIPLLLGAATNSAKFSLYAASEFPNGDPFYVVRDGSKSGPYDLPVYREKTGTATRVLLTPVTFALDAAWFLEDADLKQKEEDREKEAQFPSHLFDAPQKKK
jgi:hypothetical protein